MMTLLRHPGRLWRVLVVFSRYFILPKLPFRAPPEPGAVRMRLAIEELGGAWVKLGQMLAMRFDLLPPAYCSELLKLLGQVRPFSYDDVRSIVTRGAWRSAGARLRRRSSSGPLPPLRSARSIARSSRPESASRSRSSARGSAPTSDRTSA